MNKVLQEKRLHGRSSSGAPAQQSLVEARHATAVVLLLLGRCVCPTHLSTQASSKPAGCGFSTRHYTATHAPSCVLSSSSTTAARKKEQDPHLATAGLLERKE